MPRLPTSVNVDNVSPRVKADPGARLPSGAFDEPLGVAAAEIAPAVQAFADVKIRQENRRDTVDRADKINTFRLEAENELRKLETESDLSKDEVLHGFGSYLSKRRAELINEHGGTEESRAILGIRLQDIDSSIVGQAAGKSAALGRKKVTQAFEDSISPLASRLADDPTPDRFRDSFNELETHINDFRGEFDPSGEQSLRSGAREHLSLSAIDSLLSRGKVETADKLLATPEVLNSMSMERQREVRRRIDTMRYRRDKESSKLISVYDPTSPTGFRYTPEIKAAGMPAATEATLLTAQKMAEERKAAEQKAEQRQKMVVRRAKVVVRDIDRSLKLLDESFLPVTGRTGQALAFLSEGSARNLQEQIDSIKSNISQQSLMETRESSPNGSSFGNITDRDISLLEKSLGSLATNQDPEILKENLKQIREIYLNAWFGSPEEIAASVEEGRMSQEQAAKLTKERNTVGFDAIGRPVNQEPKKAGKTAKAPVNAKSLEEDDIMIMGLGDLAKLDIKSLSDEQKRFVKNRFQELKK